MTDQPTSICGSRHRRGARMPLLVVALIATIAAGPHVAFAQGATARAIVGTVKYQRPGVEGNPGPGQLLLSLFLNRPRALDENATLNDKDGLLGENAESAVQLVCANGSTLVLTGEFDAYLRLGAGGGECTVYLRAGTAIATTAPGDANAGTIPTIIEYGTVTLGARSTQFGATVVSERGAPETRADAFVIEGSVEVVEAASGGVPPKPLLLQAGQLLAASSARLESIDDRRFDSMAATYAKLEVQAVPLAQRAVAQAELQQGYARTLRQPGSAEAQRNLLAVYQARGLADSPAVKYHDYRLSQATKLNRETNLQRVAK